MKKITKKLTKENLVSIIKKDLPQLEIKSCELNDGGWDNIILEINDEYIFKFPKDKNSKLDLEEKALELLKGKTALQIPELKFIGESCQYVGYKKIPGESLSKRCYRMMSEEQKDKLAFDLANFLFEFHSATTVKKSLEMGFREEDHNSYAKWIEKKLKKYDPDIAQFAKETVSDYRKTKMKKKEEVLLYNDLHENNMAFNKKKKKINGVFDFGDVMVGDVNRDFHYFYRFDSDLLNRVIREYEKISNKKLDRNRIIIYSAINELCDWGEAFDDPRSDLYKKNVRLIRQMMWARKFVGLDIGSGIHAIYKPKGPTSNRVVMAVKKATGVKKVGHAGTLDPLARGVLVVAVGKEFTKKIATEVDKEKEYIAEIKLGQTSTTDDDEGEKTKIKIENKSKKNDIELVIKKFIGKIEQIPPKFSAVKISGKEAYKRIRKGEEFEMAKREVEIKEIELLSYKWPNLKIRVVTAKGVYIRSLARDIGEELKVGGYLIDLERTRVGEFGVEDCVKI